MKQYIDKSALVAEIERLHKKWEMGNYVHEKLISFLNTLEVKEVHDIWHDVSEKPELEQPLLIIMKGTHKDFRRHYRIGCYGKRANDIPTWVIAGCYSDSFISKWCYISDILQYTFEVKEVDLDYIKKELDEVVRIYKPNGHFGWGTLYNVATHFYELGLKTQMKTSLREKDDGKNT